MNREQKKELFDAVLASINRETEAQKRKRSRRAQRVANRYRRMAKPKR